MKVVLQNGELVREVHAHDKPHKGGPITAIVITIIIELAYAYQELEDIARQDRISFGCIL